jgi:hypothetical protein
VDNAFHLEFVAREIFTPNEKLLLQKRYSCSISPLAIFADCMKSSISRGAFLFLLVPTCALAARSVVNMSHYDMMRPDFAAMKREGIVGVIHEATYPSFQRDSKYLDRQMGAV